METRIVVAVQQADDERDTKASKPMTPADLRKACHDSPYHFVLLKIPRRARSTQIRLLPNAGPMGKVGDVRDNGVTLARFSKVAVLAWLDEVEGVTCPNS